MIPVALREVAKIVGGTLVGGSAEKRVMGATVDSRQVRGGELFFALEGERVSGRDFAPDAIAKGAVAAVAAEPLPVPTIVVGEPLAALQELARWELPRLGARVVGITGTVGKTTTKDALAAVLREAGVKVAATAGNFNNEIGLPLTILAVDDRVEVLVLEMGATHPGDIERLCGIAPPEIGVLTAISPVHLESFGSFEGLVRTKGELAMALPEGGTLVAPLGAPPAATGKGRNLKRVTFGSDPAADLHASEVEETGEGLSFRLESPRGSARVNASVYGTHLVQPLLAAFGGALALGLTPEDCARGVQRLRRTGLRGELYRLKDGISVYDDSYNASPAAVAAVLRYGASQSKRHGGRFVAVLGGMFELGSRSRDYHREAGELAQKVGVDLLVAVGEEARWYVEGFSGPSVCFPDARAASEALVEHLRPGDYVVIKGSRGVGLERVSRRLREILGLV